jgi:hypothetical protein
VVTGAAVADPVTASVAQTDIISMRFMTHSLTSALDETRPAQRRSDGRRMIHKGKTARQDQESFPIRQ